MEQELFAQYEKMVGLLVIPISNKIAMNAFISITVTARHCLTLDLGDKASWAAKNCSAYLFVSSTNIFHRV
jgi:hypothetical protein